MRAAQAPGLPVETMDAITTPVGGTSPREGHTYRMPGPRLRLTPDTSHGPLDGAWWPRCSSLELELPALVASLEPADGAVTHVTVDPDCWRTAPRRVMAPGHGHVIEVATARLPGKAHMISVECGVVGRWELLVIPPDEPAEAADELLAAAADPENMLSAPRMLARIEEYLAEETAWESQGGYTPRS
ncbi:DUF5994 family protein [Streptomyces sp. BH105]|uniref:DUF5994 family protein n=1 Tax=Streptomyces sp. BH105 TaxID=3410408 RepID=UPI003CF17568